MGWFGKKKPALREASVESIGEALSSLGLSCSQLSTGGVMSIEFLDKESNDFLDTESMEFLDSF
ncbi:hypothetical protein CKJ80_01290 [Corynebacterium hadale]|uniref:Uncharacterized protein n=1 Tax=Corynebacterium hadale TaxID=2026255 RepID=A0AB36RN34_9CORY|nr:hypothetical protein CKJ80_01290 [Corynebacterium hadale]